MPQPVRINHVEVFLELNGFTSFTHEQLSARLGVEPTRIYVAGRPVHPDGFGRLSRHNRWLLQAYTKEGPWLLFEEQMDQLLAVVAARWEAFDALAGQVEVVVGCAVMVYGDETQSTPAVHLERRHVAMLERLHAEFDVDIYCFQK